MNIIKILYEKVLSLDHHFASVRTFSEINKIANPNHYPEFAKLKEELEEPSKKNENPLQLTNILGNNLFASVTQTLINLTTSSGKKDMEEKERQELECIMDFTLRMHNDLNTVYYETSFLQKRNESIKKSIEKLFKDYTKPIKYFVPLGECRANDDWDILREKLQATLDKIEGEQNQTKAYKYNANIEFSIDRLLQFISQYNAFIDEGEQFYGKFKIILNSYENEQICEPTLQTDYKKLKADIDVAIDKFKVAYKPIEINGSKMKEILYGVNEYE